MTKPASFQSESATFASVRNALRKLRSWCVSMSASVTMPTLAVMSSSVCAVFAP